MAVSYRRLWHLMLDKKVNKSGLEKLAGISHHSILKMNRGEDVSTEVLTKICTALECEVKDIVEFLPEKRQQNLTQTVGGRYHGRKNNVLPSQRDGRDKL